MSNGEKWLLAWLTSMSVAEKHLVVIYNWNFDKQVIGKIKYFRGRNMYD